MADNLPQLDGSLVVFGFAGPVTVDRDAHGVPHIRAGSLDDMYSRKATSPPRTACSRWNCCAAMPPANWPRWLAAICWSTTRFSAPFSCAPAADRALAALPKDQRHWLDVYARGVNASMIAQRDHLPVEFAWSDTHRAVDPARLAAGRTRDVSGPHHRFPGEARSRGACRPPLARPDRRSLPVGSWRDHPPGQPIPDLTAPRPISRRSPRRVAIEAQRPSHKAGCPRSALSDLGLALRSHRPRPARPATGACSFRAACDSCVAGSGSWAVSARIPPRGSRCSRTTCIFRWQRQSYGMRRTSRPPIPRRWQPSTLPGSRFRECPSSSPATTTTSPGDSQPRRDVQDLYVEHTRGTPTGRSTRLLAASGGRCSIAPRSSTSAAAPISCSDVPITLHGGIPTPIVSSLSSLFPNDAARSARGTIYDPANVTAPFLLSTRRVTGAPCSTPSALGADRRRT